MFSRILLQSTFHFFFDVFAGSGSLPFLTFPDIIAPGEDDSGKKKYNYKIKLRNKNKKLISLHMIRM